MDHSSIFLWDKVKRNTPSRYWKMLVKQVTGACSKTCILCQSGWEISNLTLKLFLRKVLMKISDVSFHLNHHPYQWWKSSLRPSYKTRSRLQTKLQKIWNQILEEPSVNLIRLTSIKLRLIRNSISRHCSLDFACIILWFLVEPNSDRKDGQESTTTMMVIWEFVVKFSITTWQVSRKFLTLIYSICMVKSCMVAISQTTGTEERTTLTLRNWSDHKSWKTCNWQCHKVSDHQIQPRRQESNMKPRSMNYLQRTPTCSGFIQMQKLDTWQILVRVFASQFCNAPEVAEVAVAARRMSKSMNLLSNSWINCHNSSTWSNFDQKPKRELHMLSYVCKNAREWILLSSQLDQALKILMLVWRAHSISLKTWRSLLNLCSSTKFQLCGRNMHMQARNPYLRGSMIYLRESISLKNTARN